MAEKGIGRVNADWLNMRTSPGGEVLTVLKQGTELQVIGRSGSWLEVQHGNEQGYVSSRYITIQPSGQVAVPSGDAERLRQGEVTASSLNLRRSPNGEIVGSLVQGTLVTILSDQEGWLEVKIDQAQGYVSGRYIKPLDRSIQPETLTPNPLPATDTAVSFEGEWAVGPDGQRFGKKFKKGIYSSGSTRIGAFIQQNREAINSVTSSQLCLLEGVSENEGKLEAINTWDNAFLSFGIFQWTAGVGNEAGELPALFDRLQQRFPETYHKYFGQYGLEVSGVRDIDGSPGRGYFKLNGQVLGNGSDKEVLRSLVWPYLCKMAGMDDKVRLVQLEHAMARIDCFLKVDRLRIRGHYIGDYVTSEYGVAQLLDQHVNRPAHVISTLREAVDSLEGQLDIDNPANWGDAEERKLLETYLVFRARTSMTDGPDRAARIKRQLDKGVLSDRRNSYQA